MDRLRLTEWACAFADYAEPEADLIERWLDWHLDLPEEDRIEHMFITTAYVVDAELDRINPDRSMQDKMVLYAGAARGLELEHQLSIPLYIYCSLKEDGHLQDLPATPVAVLRSPIHRRIPRRGNLQPLACKVGTR